MEVRAFFYPAASDRYPFAAARFLEVPMYWLRKVLGGMGDVYALHDLGLVNLHIKPTLFGANLLGGLIFGVGMLLLGF